MADVALFIPVRLGSSRLADKPLRLLHGADGEARPVIAHCWDAARALDGVASVHFLVGEERLRKAVEAIGAPVLMTSPDARNGTERCADALGALGREPDIVVNLQGDAFLTPPDHVAAVVDMLASSGAFDVATPVFAAPSSHLRRFERDLAAGRVGGTTVVTDRRGRALYFSKAVLPSTARRPDESAPWPVLHHVGLYGYRPSALRAYAELPPGELERAEGLEQLRFLENGIDVSCVRVAPPADGFWEINNPEDIAVVEAILSRDPAAFPDTEGPAS